MALETILDNWSLQEIGELLQNGLDTGETSQITINQENDSYTWTEVPRATVQIEALLNLLSDLVIRDSLQIDSNFANAWRGMAPLHTIGHSNILTVTDLDSTKEIRKPATDAALSSLCVTADMQQHQKENQAMWNLSQRVPHSFYSQLVWGTAGYLGRSAALSMPYTAHPLRKNLLTQTMFSPQPRDAATEIQNFLVGEKTRIYHELEKHSETRHIEFRLSPFVIDIIESVNTPGELLPAAIEMRNEYEKIREWVATYQRAIDDENPQALLKYKKELGSIADHISSKITGEQHGSLTISLGVKWIKYTKKINPAALFQRIGIRGALNKLIWTKKGKSTIIKLLSMFGEKNSSLSNQVLENFTVQGHIE